MKTIAINSLEDTDLFARNLAENLELPMVLALHGDLGAGKTTLTKALAKALGIKAVVNSPTFTIMKSYSMPDGNKLYHIDAYRLEGMDDELGFEEFFDQGLCVIEWPQYLELDENLDILHIHINKVDEDQKRSIVLEPKGKRAELLEEVL